MPYFALIIMFYHVKIACYQLWYPSSVNSSLHTSAEWCVTKEKSYLVGHGAIYDEFLETTCIPLGICA